MKTNYIIVFAHIKNIFPLLYPWRCLQSINENLIRNVNIRPFINQKDVHIRFEGLKSMMIHKNQTYFGKKSAIIPEGKGMTIGRIRWGFLFRHTTFVRL